MAEGKPTGDGATSAVFRLLLPPSFTDADTFLLYAAVNPLRRRTASALHVRVDPLDPSATDPDATRVAVVLGPTAPVRRVEASSSTGEPLVLSPVQEALVAVTEVDGALHRAPACGVACMLLVEAARLEAGAGRGVLGRIALETGAGMRVVPWEMGLPSLRGQQSDEEVVEITGDRSTVRKGLVALSSCLQGDQPAGGSNSVKKDRLMISRAPSGMRDPSTGTFCSGEHEQRSVPQFNPPQSVTGGVQTKGRQQISFRLLCPIDIAGGLIGAKGLVIKGIEDETGACIVVDAPLIGCSERVITISALENPDSDYHAVQSAVLQIFDRMQVVGSKPVSMSDQPPQSSVRALVLKSQFGYLVGLSGSTIQKMAKATGAKIKILQEPDVPACGSKYELVLQITGQLMNVRNALCLVCSKLRDHAFSFNDDKNNKNDCAPTPNVAEPNATSQVNISSTGDYSTDISRTYGNGPYGINSAEKSFSDLQLSSSEVQKTGNVNGNGMNNLNNEERSGNGINKSNYEISSTVGNNLVREVDAVRITRVTFETVISGDLLHLVYGANGNNLIHLREITGAEISVYDPSPEGKEATVVVSGSPDNSQAAQNLLVKTILQEVL